MMGVADCGWGMFFARNCQEAADLTAIARRVAEDGETPWFVAQDGFLTTHTIENVQLPEDELLKRFVGDPRVTVRDLFDPKDALMSGVVQNQDSYMKGRIAQRAWYDRLVAITERAMAEWDRPDRPPLRPDRDVQDRRRRLRHGLDGDHGGHRARGRRPAPGCRAARSAASPSRASGPSRPRSWRRPSPTPRSWPSSSAPMSPRPRTTR